MATIDWTGSMVQTFEFFKVDPVTWFEDEPIRTIKSLNITRDSEDDTLQHASIEADEIDGEMYVRVYLKAIQNGFTFREPLGTFLVQTPSISFDGKEKSSSIDAYSPLLELKEKKPPIGFSLLQGQPIMDNAARLTEENLRAPVVKEIPNTKIIEHESGFVSETDDTWLSFLKDLIANAEYDFGLTPLGEVIFLPYQNASQMVPAWEYSDDNNSILYPEITMNRDMYEIPNVVEVVHSTSSSFYVATCINDNPDSPTSITRRGREIVHRVNNPDTLAMATEAQLDAYAEQLLRNLSTMEYRISYTHGYCPVQVGDCVRITYRRAGIINVKAKVVSQTIKCETGCSVTEEAIFTKNLWKD